MTIQQTLLSNRSINWQAGSTSTTGYSSLAGRTVVVAPSGNIYTFADINSPTTFSGCLTKYDSAGNVLFQKVVANIQPQSSSASLCLDSSENVFVAGIYKNGATNLCGVAKYNSSGSLQWSRTYGAGATTTMSGVAVAINSSNEIYVLASGFASVLNSYILKVDNSGSLLAQCQLSLSSYYFGPNSIAVDASNNIYITCSSDILKFEGYLIKLDSSFAIQWQKYISTASTSVSLGSIAFDTDNNVYVPSSLSVGGSLTFVLFKFNTSGTLIWQNQYSNVRLLNTRGGISLDAQNIIYLSGMDDYILKVTTSGAVVWLTSISGGTGSTILGLKTQANYVALSGGIAGGAPPYMSNFTFKIPTYQKLGTFVLAGVSFGYADLTGIVSVSSGSLGVAAGSATVATPSETYASVTVTTTDAPYTQNLVYT